MTWNLFILVLKAVDWTSIGWSWSQKGGSLNSLGDVAYLNRVKIFWSTIWNQHDIIPGFIHTGVIQQDYHLNLSVYHFNVTATESEQSLDPGSSLLLIS